MDDQNPELDGAGEGATDLELELEVTPKTEKPKAPDSDPLDEIKDETVRAEAKKHRAIARRLEKKEEVPAPVSPSPEFLTKSDFYKSNERKAIMQITADAEVKANWQDIVRFYTPRRGKDTPEDIVEDIKDAVTLYKARTPAHAENGNATDLTVTPIVKAGGGTVKDTDKTVAPPNFKLPAQPSSWYPKPK